MIVKFKDVYKEIISMRLDIDNKLIIILKSEYNNKDYVFYSSFKVKRLPPFKNGYIDLTKYTYNQLDFNRMIKN